MRVRVYPLFYEATVRLLFQFDANRLRCVPIRSCRLAKKRLLGILSETDFDSGYPSMQNLKQVSEFV